MCVCFLMLFCHLVITVCTCTFVTCTLIKISQSINQYQVVSDASKKLVLPSISDTSLSSLMTWKLQSYPTTVLNERKWQFRGKSKHTERPSWVLKIMENLWAVEAPPRTTPGELTALLRPPSWWGGGCCPLPKNMTLGLRSWPQYWKSWTHPCAIPVSGDNPLEINPRRLHRKL